MLSPDPRHHRRFQADSPLIALSDFGQPPLDPRVRDKLMENGLVPTFADSVGLNRLMEENRATFREVIRAANIRAQ